MGSGLYYPYQLTQTGDRPMTEHNQQFDTFDQWVARASQWLTRHPDYSDEKHDMFRVICFDAQGRLCRNGRDFAKARDEDAFPVKWLWPDQVGPMALAASRLVDKWDSMSRYSIQRVRHLRPCKEHSWAGTSNPLIDKCCLCGEERA